MLGWRARLGIMLPSVNTTTEPEFYRMAPPGVTCHFARMEFERTEPKYYEGMVEDVPPLVRKLAHARVDAIAFGCTSGSLYGGLGYDRKIIDMIREVADLPVTTTSTALVEALSELKVRKIAVATPYQDWINDLEKKFLEGYGLEVLSMGGLGLTGFDVCELKPEEFYRFAKGLARPGMDALFMSCMGLRTLEIIPILERDLGCPVLSSNQVTMWALLRLAGVREPGLEKWFGSLMALL